jgi:hypothetical protein
MDESNQVDLSASFSAAVAPTPDGARLRRCGGVDALRDATPVSRSSR